MPNWERLTDAGDVLIYTRDADGNHCITWGYPHAVTVGHYYTPVIGAAMAVLTDEEFGHIPAVVKRDAQITALKAELAKAREELARIPPCFIAEDRETDGEG